MEKYVYYFLNTLTFFVKLILSIVYKACLTKCEAWHLVLVSLFLFIVMTSLMLVNALRLNLEMGVSDEIWNIFVFLFGTNAVILLAILPTQVLLVTLIPHNVEASTQAIISGVYIWAFEVGAKASASAYCAIFNVDKDHIDNYPLALEAKIPVIVLMMCLTVIIPNNDEILFLSSKLRRDHLKFLIKQSEQSIYL